MDIDQIGKAGTITGIVVIVCLVVWLVPLLTIWCLNTLFHLGIGYSLAEWFATLCLQGILYNNGYKSK